GDIQQLQIVPSPEAAYEQCIDYMPDCEFPLPYSQGPEDTVFPEFPGITNSSRTDDDDDEFTDYSYPESIPGVFTNYSQPVRTNPLVFQPSIR
ncbi:hypothetical protein AVEN_130493-1, partial [Araneus ventricosus]